MKLITIQIALFTKDIIGRPDKLSNIVNNRMDNLFDAMPSMMNLPVDAPVEVPLVKMMSSNGTYGVNIARNRIDLMLNLNDECNIEPHESWRMQYPIIEKYYKAILSNYDVIRMGIICNLFEIDDENVKHIYEKYLKTEYSSSNIEVGVRFNKRTQVKNLQLNNICIIENSAISKDSGEVKNGVLIQYDTNNVPDSNKILTESNLMSIINQAVKHLQEQKVGEGRK